MTHSKIDPWSIMQEITSTVQLQSVCSRRSFLVPMSSVQDIDSHRNGLPQLGEQACIHWQLTRRAATQEGRSCAPHLAQEHALFFWIGSSSVLRFALDSEVNAEPNSQGHVEPTQSSSMQCSSCSTSRSQTVSSISIGTLVGATKIIGPEKM